MWPFTHTRTRENSTPRIFFHNTLTGRKDLFVPLKPGEVTLYSCGPTVYSKQHIGNLRAPFLADLIARVLVHAGFHIRRVINITDVGHLVDDGDDGEDKMALGAKKEKKSPEEIADHYAREYINDLTDIAIDTKHILFPRATEYIKEQIALAKTLEEKGFAYYISDGLYFDTSKFPEYGKLGGFAGASLKEGARVPKVLGKRHASDFALWRTARPHDLQQWDSPWGRGNPGWHLECSAMSRTLLGIELDIHTGGEDLIPVHHNNEIAQSEAANGRPFVRYWIHNAFATIQGEKISKSLGNVVYLSDIVEHGFHPLALRYFFLQAHYRTPLSFTWESIGAAHEALVRLWRLSDEIATESKRKAAPSEAATRFIVTVEDDLSTPQALGQLWDSLKSEDLTPQQKWGLLVQADALFGLMLTTPPADYVGIAASDIPKEVQKLLQLREEARLSKDFVTSDQLRAEIENRGYRVEDRQDGPVLTKDE